eukprot:7317361-Lingulodinium_polyedra.AAC.1
MPTKTEPPVRAVGPRDGHDVEPARPVLSPVRGLVGVDARNVPFGKEAAHGGDDLSFSFAPRLT